jgi:prepilin-type N-terminal cleavage/methylation domain-containing protein
MKTQHPSSRLAQAGFTLVELLVVIVIIAILASLAVPVTNKVMENANKLRIKATMKDLQVAIGHYRTEYNRFPVDLTGSTGGEDIDPIPTDGSNSIITTLMAASSGDSNSNMNRRNIKFIDLPYAKNGSSFGIVDSSSGTGGADLKLVDIWGMPYQILLDTNYDNRISNPDASNVDQMISSRAPQYISTSAGVHCYGPDKIVNTKDDIVSWR